MKYLVTLREDTRLTTRHTPERVMELVEANLKYWDTISKKENCVVDFGLFGITSGTYAVLEVKTNADLFRIVDAAPYRALAKFEYTPVLGKSEFGDIISGVKKDIINHARASFSIEK